MTEPEDSASEHAANALGLRIWREIQKRKAAEAERDNWAQEAIAHRRRLGIPVPGTGKRLKRADIKQTLGAPAQTTESTTGIDSGEEGEEVAKKKRLNQQPTEQGGMVDPATSTRKAVIPVLPSTTAEGTGGGLLPGTDRVDGLGRPLGDQPSKTNRKGSNR